MEEEVVKVGGGQWRLEGDGKGMIAAVRKESPSSKRLMNSSNEGGREVGHVGGCERRVEETGDRDREAGRGTGPEDRGGCRAKLGGGES